MTTRDRTPHEKLTNLPPMSAERDTTAERRTSLTGGRRSGGGGLFTTLAAMVVVMLTGATYFLWLEYQEMQKVVADADKRIAGLEAQLASTGDEMSKSDSAVRVQLSTLDKEVRRLEQNRKKDKDILVKNEKGVKNLTTRTTKTNTKQNAIHSQITVLAAELDDVVETLDSASFSEDRKNLQQALLRLQQTDDEIGVLAKRVSDAEEWLNAIDAFRKQANTRLNTIENPAQQTPQLQ